MLWQEGFFCRCFCSIKLVFLKYIMIYLIMKLFTRNMNYLFCY